MASGRRTSGEPGFNENNHHYQQADQTHRATLPRGPMPSVGQVLFANLEARGDTRSETGNRRCHQSDLRFLDDRAFHFSPLHQADPARLPSRTDRLRASFPSMGNASFASSASHCGSDGMTFNQAPLEQRATLPAGANLIRIVDVIVGDRDTPPSPSESESDGSDSDGVDDTVGYMESATCGQCQATANLEDSVSMAASASTVTNSDCVPGFDINSLEKRLRTRPHSMATSSSGLENADHVSCSDIGDPSQHRVLETVNGEASNSMSVSTDCDSIGSRGALSRLRRPKSSVSQTGSATPRCAWIKINYTPDLLYHTQQAEHMESPALSSGGLRLWYPPQSDNTSASSSASSFSATPSLNSSNKRPVSICEGGAVGGRDHVLGGVSGIVDCYSHLGSTSEGRRMATRSREGGTADEKALGFNKNNLARNKEGRKGSLRERVKAVGNEILQSMKKKLTRSTSSTASQLAPIASRGRNRFSSSDRKRRAEVTKSTPPNIDHAAAESHGLASLFAGPTSIVSTPHGSQYFLSTEDRTGGRLLTPAHGVGPTHSSLESPSTDFARRFSPDSQRPLVSDVLPSQNGMFASMAEDEMATSDTHRFPGAHGLTWLPSVVGVSPDPNASRMISGGVLPEESYGLEGMSRSLYERQLPHEDALGFYPALSSVNRQQPQLSLRLTPISGSETSSHRQISAASSELLDGSSEVRGAEGGLSLPRSSSSSLSGPLRVHTTVDFVHCLVPVMDRLSSACYYWGEMDRYEAERLLEGRPEGTFLLRDSAQDDFLFSVSFNRYGRSLHARIEQWGHKFSFDSCDSTVFRADTISSLLKRYSQPNQCMFFEPMLTIPLKRSFPFSLRHLSRCAITSHVSYDGIDSLPLPRRLQEYLRYYHYKHQIRVRTLLGAPGSAAEGQREPAEW